MHWFYVPKGSANEERRTMSSLISIDWGHDKSPYLIALLV